MSIATPQRHSITVGQLRQNPMRMLADVMEGEAYTITNHGRAIADVVPHEDQHWVPVDRVRSFLARSGNEAWARELREERSEDDLQDPWA